jgi:hypothetical protein
MHSHAFLARLSRSTRCALVSLSSVTVKMSPEKQKTHLPNFLAVGFGTSV